MSYTKAPKNHGEFSGGPGLVDPEQRKDRNIGPATGPLVDERVGEELLEIYATNPAIADEDLATVQIERPTKKQIADLTGDV